MAGLKLGCAVFAVITAAGCADTPNSPPTFVNLANRLEIEAERTFELEVLAQDPDGDKITLSARDLPGGATFNTAGASGTLEWTPARADADPSAGSTIIFFDARDDRGASASHALTLVVSPSDTAPKFTTSNQRILDLNTSDTLEANIEVKDDDSLEVSFSLVAGPEGMTLTPLSAKSTRLTWSPSEAQIMERLVWSATIKADDNTGGVTTQELSITLLNAPSPQCDPTTPPTVVHQPLGDQDQATNYLVEATITDAESPVLQATLYWTTGEDTSSDLQSRPMIAQEDRYRAEIPNPVIDASASVTVSYFICVQDNDDLSGEACDNIVCDPPSGGAHRFTATPPAGVAPLCEPDAFEPNDAPGAAARLNDAARIDAMMCQDDDFFAVSLSQGERLAAVATFSHDEVDIDMLMIDPDQLTIVSESADVIDRERVAWTAREDGDHFIQLFSFGGGDGAYALSIERCTNDTDEPNDEPMFASEIGDGILISRILCLGELDVFRVPVSREGTLIDVELALMPEDRDAVTMALFNGELDIVANGVPVNNSLTLVHNTSDSTDYLLVVASDRETNPPILFDLLVVVE